MSIIIDRTLRCDACGNTESSFSSHTAKQTRSEARRAEWVYIKGKDYCPKCKPVNQVITKRFGYVKVLEPDEAG